jgi:hypothetical protein
MANAVTQAANALGTSWDGGTFLIWLNVMKVMRLSAAKKLGLNREGVPSLRDLAKVEDHPGQ